MSIVGIDPAAEKAGMAVIDDRGRVIDQRMVSNTRSGWKVVARVASEAGAVVGIEGLYGWGLALALYLDDHGVGLCAVEPWQTAQLRRAQPVHRKDDLSDALWAARAVGMWGLERVTINRGLVDLGIYLTHHEGLVKAQTQRANRIHNILGRVDPTYGRELGRIRSRSQWDKLRSYQHPRLGLAAATIRDTANDGHSQWDRLRLGEAILEGLLPPLGGILTERFCGIGPLRAAQILVYSGDMGRFRSEAAYAAFCGIAPAEHSSGRTQRRTISRGGHRRLHSVFIGAINTQTQVDRTRTGYVARREAAGTPRPIAKTAAARKLVRSVYKTLLNNQHMT